MAKELARTTDPVLNATRPPNVRTSPGFQTGGNSSSGPANVNQAPEPTVEPAPDQPDVLDDLLTIITGVAIVWVAASMRR